MSQLKVTSLGRVDHSRDMWPLILSRIVGFNSRILRGTNDSAWA